MTKTELERRPKRTTLGERGTSGLTHGRKVQVNRAPVVEDGFPQRGAVDGQQEQGGRFHPDLGTLYQLNKDSNYKNPSLIDLIASETTLKVAYESIKSKPGNMTPGLDGETLDGLSSQWISETSAKLKNGDFRFSPARRKNIPKPGKNETRPLGINSPREKVVQKAMELVLNAVYEPTFKDSSHGFRPGRGNHTALKQARYALKGKVWVIEGDLKKCFDSIDHDALMGIIRKKITCRPTLQLIEQGLKAGFIDPDFPDVVNLGDTGTPQGSVLSPLLANIILHELDEFMEDMEKQFYKGATRARNLTYAKLTGIIRSPKLTPEDRRLLKIERRKISAVDPLDPNFRRLCFIRYADDFIVGVTGTHSDAVTLKDKIKTFLHDKLRLTLNVEKTKITHFTKTYIHFLGTNITGKVGKQKPLALMKRGDTLISRGRVTPEVQMKAPMDKILGKMVSNGFCRDDKGKGVRPTAVGRLQQLDHGDIVRYYNQVVAGVLNYYSFVDNKNTLAFFIYLMKRSCALTLVQKFRLKHASKAFKQFGPILKDAETGIEFKEFDTKQSHQFLISQKSIDEIMRRRWSGKLTRTNLDKTCLVCGASYPEMHHVKHIKDLKTLQREGKIDFWTMQMRAINRKQIPLCKEHHVKLHGGGLSEEETLNLKLGIAQFTKTKMNK